VIVIGGEALVDLVEEDGGRLRPVAGGGPFNTAIALGRMGVPVAFFGTLSRDDYGILLGGLLGEAGVDTSLVRWSDAPTPLAIVHHHGDGRNTYTFYLHSTSFADLPVASLPALPDDAWGIHVGTLALAVDPPAVSFEALVDREVGRRRIILDPNVRPALFGDPVAYRERFERIAKIADVVKLSEDDAAWIYPDLAVGDVLERVLALGPRLVAVTKGEGGAVAASADAAVDVPALPVTVVDTVGAGDTFGAALVAALLERGALAGEAAARLDEALLRGAVAYAAAAAAITCTRVGAVPPTREEIRLEAGDWLAALEEPAERSEASPIL
jgi:fructokinase